MPLADTFLSRLTDGTREPARALPDLEERLVRACATGREAWPRLPIADADFAAHLGDRLAADPAIATTLGELHVADLWLACACARGVDGALAAFEAAHFGEIAIACRKRTDLKAPVDDVAQLVRERLFVAAPGARPRVAEYSGRGSLRAWFRVAVVRLISNLAARPSREVSVDDDAVAAFPVLTADPELDYMKRQYKVEFQAALSDALAALPARDRTLLRHSLVENLTIDQLAVVYGAHRATLARWIAKARGTLLEGLRSSLMQRLQLEPAEFESVLVMIRSRFDLTVSRLFADPGKSRG